MIAWTQNKLARYMDQQAERRFRQNLRSRGEFLELSFVLGKYAGPRATVFTPSLGCKGHRDWTQLQAASVWPAQADREQWGDVFKRLVNTVKAPAAEFDIAEVTNILLSKSKLTNFATMKAFEDRSPNHEYGHGTHRDLQRCLNHDEVRCLKGTLKLSDSFSSFGWDERLLLNNQGGSHNFSAARRIAMELDVHVPLQLTIEHHRLDAETVQLVERSLALLIIPNKSLLDDLKYALKAEGVPVVPGTFRPLVYCGEGATLLPMSLNDDTSSQAALYLRSCGFTDLVDHLTEDLGLQKARTPRTFN